MNHLVGALSGRRWSTDILEINSGEIFISGGASQGIKIGDKFSIETKGKTVASGQTGMPITLPGKKVAEIEVTSLFGSDSLNEGAIARLISGALQNRPAEYVVVEN